MGVTTGGDAAKSSKKTHLLVIMRVRLWNKVGLLDLKNRTRFKNGTAIKYVRKSVSDYWGMSLMIHARSIYY